MTRRATPANMLRRRAVEQHARPHPIDALASRGRTVMYCATCDVQIDVGLSLWELDHRVPHALGGSDETENLQVLCLHCHRRKTFTKDIPIIAKVTRVREKHQGVKRSSKPMPFGRRSHLKKTIDGRIVPRE